MSHDPDSDDPAVSGDAAGPMTARALWRDRGFSAAAIIAVVVALGFGIVVPLLPLFARSFDVSLFAATSLVSVFAGVRLASNLYTGALTDRIGTRRAVGWGALIVAVSSVLAGASPGYWWLLVFRGLGGFGSALFFNALLAHVVLLVPPTFRGRAIAMLQGAFLFGITLGPTVGTLLAAPLGLRWPFVIYGGFCVAAAWVAFALLPRAPARSADDPAPERGVRPLLRTAARFCADPTFVVALVLMAAARWAATGVRFSVVPIFGEEVVGVGVVGVGLAVTISSLGHVATLWPAGRIIDTKGRRVLAAPAYAAFAAASAALVLSGSLWTFLLLMLLYGIGTGLTSVTPPAIVGDVTEPKDAGKAMGVLNTAGDLGSVAGPLVSGWLADAAGYGWGFGASAGLLLAAAIVALRMRETLPAARADAA